jgi:hypothetical protein
MTATEFPRPFASNDRVNALNRPQPILRTAKDGTSPFTTIDRRLLKDKALNATLRGILVNLLDHADSWEFVNIAKDIAADAQCSEKTAYRYLNQLIELGYVHKIACKGGGRFDKYATAHRYKVSELPLRPDNPADVREWEYVGGAQVTRFRENGFPPGYKTKHYGTIQSEVTVEQMMPKKGRASTPKRVGKIYQTNRRERCSSFFRTSSTPYPFQGD